MRARALSRAGVAVGVMVGLLHAAGGAWAAAPEKPLTKPATEITATSATLHGELNPGASKAEVGYYFSYGTEGACPGPSKAPEPPAVLEGNHKAVSANVGELVPSSTYTFCLVAISLSGSSEGAPATFETLGEKPAVEDGSATDINSSSAVLEAQVNAENQATTYRFEYATNPALSGARTLGETSVEGFGAETAGPVSLSGLEANTPYYWRLSATNATGTTEGPIQEFLTLPNVPIATTGAASAITSTSATIFGSVDPGTEGYATQDTTSYYFQYGPTTSYGSQVPLSPGEVGEGEHAVQETADLQGLEPGATYHYRIVAVNGPEGATQASFGEDETFTTTAIPPLLSGVSVAVLTANGATITATLDPRGLPTRYELRLGASAGMLQAAASGDTSAAGTLTLSAGSLSPATPYYYRLVVTNPDGTAETPEASFTTPTGPATPNSLSQPPTPPLLRTPEIVFPSEVRPKSKSLTNAQKLAKALSACRATYKARRMKTKRLACERRARKKYRTKQAGKGRSGLRRRKAR